MGIPTLEEIKLSLDRLIWKENGSLRRSQGLWHVLIFLRHCRINSIDNKTARFETSSEFTAACFDVNGIYLPIESDSRQIYFEPCATQGNSPDKFFRHKEGPRQTYLNRIPTGLIGGGPKKPKLFAVDSATLPFTASLQPDWISVLRSYSENAEILDNLTSDFITYLFRFGVPYQRNNSSPISIASGSVVQERDEIDYRTIPIARDELSSTLRDFFGINELECAQLFPKLNELTFPIGSGAARVSFDDLKQGLIEKYVPPSNIADYVSHVTGRNEESLDLAMKGKIPGQAEVPLNILFKGVPGTGKSRLIDQIIEKHLELGKCDSNVLRINIHSATRNSFLMQGISVGIADGNVHYKEKQGAVLKHLLKAVMSPNQPFVIVLEEIQENSLNELIGDLIYLMEPSKRTSVASYADSLASCVDVVEVLNMLAENPAIYKVSLPTLVADAPAIDLIFPSNLYLLCTTNYRDDKKIIEDNLLRRFDVIDVLPQTSVPNMFASDEVREFLGRVNSSVIKIIGQIETHPDRFLIGHANFLTVTNKTEMVRALKKMVDELKEVRHVDFATAMQIFSMSDINSLQFFSKAECDDFLQATNYFDLISSLQKLSAYPFMDA